MFLYHTKLNSEICHLLWQVMTHISNVTSISCISPSDLLINTCFIKVMCINWNVCKYSGYGNSHGIGNNGTTVDNTVLLEVLDFHLFEKSKGWNYF